MGEYAATTVCPRGFREDGEAACLDALALGLAEKGYRAVGEPRISWHKISRQEAAALEPGAGIRAGDWRVQVVVDVAGDTELP